MGQRTAISENRVSELSRLEVKEAVLEECYAAREEGRWRGGGSGYPMVEAPGEWIDFANYGECTAQEHNIFTGSSTGMMGGGRQLLAALSPLSA